jgi:proliferating cell nuclear antigen
MSLQPYERIQKISGHDKKFINSCRFYMMTVHPDTLRTLFESVKELITETTLTFDKDGMRLSTINNTKTVYVYVRLNADDIRKDGVYICNEERVEVGLNIKNVYNLLRGINKQDVISMYVTNDDVNRIAITILREKDRKNEIRINQLDLDTEEYNSLLNLECNAMFSFQSTDFTTYCRSLSQITERVSIEVTEQGVLVLSGSGDIGKQSIFIGEADSTHTSGDSDKCVKILPKLYSLRFLQLFSKAQNLCNQVKMYVSDTVPLVIEFSVGTIGVVKFVLAPFSDEDM